MINFTDIEIRRADYTARVERVNRDGWMWEASGPTAGSRTRGVAIVFRLLRRSLRGAFVPAGDRLKGTPASHIVDSTAV